MTDLIVPDELREYLFAIESERDAAKEQARLAIAQMKQLEAELAELKSRAADEAASAKRVTDQIDERRVAQ